MDELIKILDENLEYINHEIKQDTIHIWVKSNRKEVICPKCKTSTKKVHSYYKRSFQDLPIQSKKVIIIINNRKMICKNPDCSTKTFAETYDFLSHKGKKTKRLEKEILNISVNISSISAARVINENIANICKSTICNIIKKKK